MPVSPAAAADEQTTGEPIEVDGEEVTPEEIAAYRNDKKWKAENTRRAQELAAQEGALAERKRQLDEREAQLRQPPPADPPAPAPDGTDEEPELDLNSLPNPLDDPSAYNAELAKRQTQWAKAHREWTRRQIAQAEGRATKRAEKAETVSRTDAARERAFARNKATIDSYFAEHPDITAAERTRIARMADTMLRNDDMGSADASGVFLFNKDAIEAADRVVRRKYYEAQAEERGFQQGLSGRGKGVAAGRVSGRAAGRPGKGASARDLVTYANSLPPNSRAQQEFYDSLTPDQLNAVLREELVAAEEAQGA